MIYKEKGFIWAHNCKGWEVHKSMVLLNTRRITKSAQFLVRVFMAEGKWACTKEAKG